MAQKKSNSYNTSGTSPTFVLSIRPRGLRPIAASAYLGGARVIAVEDLDKYFNSIPTQSGTLAGRGIHIANKAAA
jgi:hypothetical protein